MLNRRTKETDVATIPYYDTFTDGPAMAVVNVVVNKI